MKFFTDLSDRASEQISGGKNDQWQSPGGDQVIPPGQFTNTTEKGKIPPGLNDLDDGDAPGNKNGLTPSDIGIVPSGWTK